MLTLRQYLVSFVAANTRTYGGGRGSACSPVAEALKDRPPAFAAGVDVGEVVDLVLQGLNEEGRDDKQSNAAINAAINAEVYRHPKHDIIAVQGQDRIRLMTEDGEETFGDVHATATLDEIKFAMEWLSIGISCGTRRGEINAKYEINAKWREFTKAIGQ